MNRRTIGFTVIELVVAMGIIAVLIGILLPVLAKARDSSRIAVCLGNLRQIGDAQMAYLGDNQERFPNKNDQSQFSWMGKAGQGSFYGTLTATLRPFNKYLGITDKNDKATVAWCPGDIASRSSAILSTYEYCGTSYAQNQATENTHLPGYQSSMLNTLLEPGNSHDFGIRLGRITNPSRIVSMGEFGAYQDAWPFAAASTVVQRWHSSTTRYNLLFVDGHAQQIEILKSDNGVGTDYSFYWNK